MKKLIIFLLFICTANMFAHADQTPSTRKDIVVTATYPTTNVVTTPLYGCDGKITNRKILTRVDTGSADIKINIAGLDEENTGGATAFAAAGTGTADNGNTGLIMGLCFLALVLLALVFYFRGPQRKPAIHNFEVDQAIREVGNNGGSFSHVVRADGTEKLRFDMNTPTAFTVQLRTNTQPATPGH